MCFGQRLHSSRGERETEREREEEIAFILVMFSSWSANPFRFKGSTSLKCFENKGQVK